MAVYKVPQDVEADDKLIGPFSFRQFIYLIVVAISMAGAWGLSTVFIPLAIIPLPFIIFFGALALPLRKDQPMETYLSAVVSFYFLKSRKRFWQPDGISSFVTIIPPKDADRIRTKGFSQDEATKRLDYLASLVDSHGWSVRGEGVPVPETSLNRDLYYESQQVPDMMDASNSEMQILSSKLNASSNARHQQAVAQMQQASPVSLTQAAESNPLLAQDPPVVTQAQPFNPMARPQPAPIAQSTQSYLGQSERDAIAYASALAEEASEDREDRLNTSENTPDTATIERAKKRYEELAYRDDVTVETLSKEANRLEEKDKSLMDGDEVTISLR